MNWHCTTRCAKYRYIWWSNYLCSQRNVYFVISQFIVTITMGCLSITHTCSHTFTHAHTQMYNDANQHSLALNLGWDLCFNVPNVVVCLVFSFCICLCHIISHLNHCLFELRLVFFILNSDIGYISCGCVSARSRVSSFFSRLLM